MLLHMLEQVSSVTGDPGIMLKVWSYRILVILRIKLVLMMADFLPSDYVLCIETTCLLKEALFSLYLDVVSKSLFSLKGN